LALSKAGLVLGIRPVGSLFPHEQTIPSHVKRISFEIKRDGVQKDPIMIDGNSSVVLDGMHRLAAFNALGVENAVVCAVDYSSKKVILRRWARAFTPPARSFPPTELLSVGGDYRRASLQEAFSALEKKQKGMALLTSEVAFIPEGPAHLQEAVARVKLIDEFALAGGWERRFVPEDEVDVALQDGRSVVVLMRRLGKDDVLSAAKTGKLFPCKTSMHVIDPRPVAVDFPASELNRATSKILNELLKGKEERVLPPDSFYEGRRYKERLLLLNQN
jgi:hypothetical protein